MEPIKKLVQNVLSKINNKGEEVPDPKPMALPVGFTRPEPLAVTIARMVKHNTDLILKSGANIETFEEANNFDTGEDLPDAPTPYEDKFDPLHTVTRSQEIRSGFVEDIPLKEREESQRIVSKARELKGRKSVPPVAQPASPAGSGGSAGATPATNSTPT